MQYLFRQMFLWLISKLAKLLGSAIPIEHRHYFSETAFSQKWIWIFFVSFLVCVRIFFRFIDAGAPLEEKFLLSPSLEIVQKVCKKGSMDFWNCCVSNNIYLQKVSRIFKIASPSICLYKIILDQEKNEFVHQKKNSGENLLKYCKFNFFNPN